MRIFGAVLLGVSAVGALGLTFMVLASGTIGGAYGPDLLGFYLASVIIGAAIFYGVLLFGFGTIADRLQLANWLMLDIRNRDLPADQRTSLAEARRAMDRADLIEEPRQL